MDNKPSRSCDSSAEDNGNSELRRNIVNGLLRNTWGLLRSLSGHPDALEAVKIDPAVLEAQVTMQANNNVKVNANNANKQLTLQNRTGNETKVSLSQTPKLYEDIVSKNERAVLSLTPNQLNMLLKYTDMLRRQRADTQKYLDCKFCKSNGRLPYKSNGRLPYICTPHMLKDGTGRVTCPILRRLRCPRCGATGDFAHTLKYCPHTSLMGKQSNHCF